MVENESDRFRPTIWLLLLLPPPLLLELMVLFPMRRSSISIVPMAVVDKQRNKEEKDWHLE